MTKKIIFFTVFVLCLNFAFADGKVSVKQFVRYSDSGWEELDSPVVRKHSALETNGKIQVQHKYTIEDGTLYKNVFISVIMPGYIDVESLSLDNGWAVNENSKDLLPSVSYYNTDNGETLKRMCFKMECKKHDTATFTFSIDLSNLSTTENIPIYVHFDKSDKGLKYWGSTVAGFLVSLGGQVLDAKKIMDKETYEKSWRQFNIQVIE